MGSHKHKKRKKSCKEEKKHCSSKCNENKESFDGISVYNPDTDTSCSDSSEDEEKLTRLVRNSYLNHLQKALFHNFQSCIETSEASSSSFQDMVNGWTIVLEKNALKASTIREIYRKKMVSLVKYITLATTKKKLCIKGKKFSRMKSQLPIDKDTQTDSISFGEETDQSGTLAFTNSLFKSSLLNCKITAPSDGLDAAHSTFFSTSYGSRINQTMPTSTNHDVISSTSDFVCLPTLDNVNQVKLNLPQQLEDNLLKECNDVKVTKQKCNPYSNLNKKTNESFTNDCLDERLHALGLLSDVEEEENNIKQPHVITCKKSNWYAEEIAQSCNFTRYLLGLSTNSRKRVIKKIKTIFGKNEELLSELSEKNISICRKRIASIVVMELTPIYQAKKIASRQLFKYVAKKITRSLMDQSYAPDSRIIRLKVKEFFSDGKIIMSESDCCL